MVMFPAGALFETESEGFILVNWTAQGGAVGMVRNSRDGIGIDEISPAKLKYRYPSKDKEGDL